MVHCVAFGCNEKSDGGNKGLFLFPKDIARQKQWIDAVGSCRKIGENIVPWVPSKTSRLCKRHFVDDDFVRSPAVMESVGLRLKLELKKTAVPSVFPETEAYKEIRRPLTTLALGPAKRKRDSYGAFEKRNRQQIISEILHEEVKQVSGLDTCSTDTDTEMEDISGTVILSDHVSQATQTDVTATENKSFQIHPATKDMNVGPQLLTQDSGCGPDLSHLPVAIDKNYQFPEDNPVTDPDDMEIMDSEYEDDTDDDPDWRPDEWDVDMSSEDEMEEDWYECVEPEGAERNYIVSESAILDLLLLCQICGLVMSIVKKITRGAMLIITTKCTCGHARTWESMRTETGTPLVNLLGCGAITFSGASPTKVLNLFKFMNLPFVCYRTFNRIQRSFILPAIDNVWTKRQARIWEECRGREVKAGGDARCCTPGHSAKYGSYTIMDLETGQVLAVELVQSNEVKNSNAMELEGLKRALTKLDDNGVTLSDLTTDRHVQVRKYLREARPEIKHWFDGWHLSKSVKSKLVALGKKRGCEIVSQWAHSISNFLYFCAASSGGDGELVQDKWVSILNHVTNKHEGHGGRYPQCQHEQLDREWIKSGSKAHKELQLIITNKRLQGDIKKLSPAEQTSKLESQHKIVCQFAPKFYSFTYRVMQKRLYLAALHTSCNAGKEQAVTKEGVPKFKVSYPKYKAGHHVVKPVTEECSYEYVDELMEEMVKQRRMHKSHQEAENAHMHQLTSPPPLASTAHRVSKVEAVTAHKSRFTITKKFT